MEEWEESQIYKNLPELLDKTDCNVKLFANLRTIFADIDINNVDSKTTPQDRASKLYEIAIKKSGGYKTVAVALMKTKQCGVLEIFLEGYRLNGKSIPDELQPQSQERESRKRKFLLQGKIYTWEQLVGPNVLEDKFFEEFKDTLELELDKPIPLISQAGSLKEKPEYYIPRTFLYPTKLEENIFIDYSTKEHIFVVKGVTQSELRRASGFKSVNHSGNKLDKTMRFIMLDKEADFEKICKLHENKKIHLIEFKDKGYFWVKSTDSLDVVQKFSTNNGELFDEKDIIKRITSLSLSSPVAISIANSPGMGKSFTLTNLATKISETCPNAVILFVVLQEFVKQTPSIELERSSLDSILGFCCTNSAKKSILKEMLKNKAFQFSFFLDGYDEVSFRKLDIVNSFLTGLMNENLQIKIIMTTRPHLKPELEKILKTISYELLPFNELNQVEFLTQYWIKKHGASNESLSGFARKCLSTLSTKMTDRERHIAGIPLQCKMLADVYAEKAKRAVEPDQFPEDVIEDLSFFQLYKSLFDFKFQRIPDSLTEQICRDAHVHDSFDVLFPDWLKEFQPHLRPREWIDDTTMFSVGLVEKSPVSDVPRFVHRTFAEHHLADFIAVNLKSNGHKASISVKFLIKEILNRLRRLDYPVIAYFVDMYLQDKFFKDNEDDSDLNVFAHLNALNLENISEENASIATASCCYNGLESTFNLMAQVIKQLRIEDSRKLNDKYLKRLPHIVVENTNSVTILKKVLNFTRVHFGENLIFCYPFCEEEYQFRSRRIPDLERHRRQNRTPLMIRKWTPLHAAAYKGKYNIVIHLLEEYGQEIFSMEHLLHACVHESASDSETVTEEKLSIIEALTQANSKWLEEVTEGRTPLLRNNVHETIVKKLVECGANINACSSDECETVLHTMMKRNDGNNSKKSLSNFLRWALDNGFSSFNVKKYEDKTLLMEIIDMLGTIDHEDLRKLRAGRADFNEKDRLGNSVLFYAIQHSGNHHFIKQILEYEANPNHRNNKGENAAHVIFKQSPCSRNPSLALELLELLKLYKFNGMQEKDEEGCTPYMLAIRNGITLDDKFIKFLKNENVDFNAQDKSGNSVLFYALKYSEDIDFIQKILDLSKNLTGMNNDGNNAAHIVMERKSKNPSLTLPLLKLLEPELKIIQGFNQPNNFGRTPIMNAIQYGVTLDDKVLNFLKHEDVDFYAEDNDGDSVLFYAVKHSKDINFIEKILKLDANTTINQKNKKGQNAADIVLDCLKDDAKSALRKLKLLVSKGFDGFNQSISPDGNFFNIISAVENTKADNTALRLFFETASTATDPVGNTILFYAIQHFNSKDLVSTILQQGVDVNHQNKYGENAAHFVLKHNKDDTNLTLELLELLKLHKLTKFDQEDRYGCTPFMMGILYKGVVEPEIFQFLLEKINFNAQNERGHSVLFYAIQHSKNYDFIQKILGHGANPNHRAEYGENAAHLVLKLECYHNEPALAVKVLKLLKSNGFDGLNKGDATGETPIMAAIRTRKILEDEFLQLLFREGVDFNAEGSNGNSVLFYSIIFSRNLYFIRRILDMGADPNHVNKIGENAAHYALLSYNSFRDNEPKLVLDILKLLESRGFQGFNQKDGKENTPLKFAMKKGFRNEEFMNFLRDKTSQ